MDLWLYKNEVHLDFIGPGRPVESGYIESLTGSCRSSNTGVATTTINARITGRV